MSKNIGEVTRDEFRELQRRVTSTEITGFKAIRALNNIVNAIQNVETMKFTCGKCGVDPRDKPEGHCDNQECSHGIYKPATLEEAIGEPEKAIKPE